MSEDVKKNPGRPRKVLEDGVSQEPTVKIELPATAAPVSTLTSTAYGLGRDKHGDWNVFIFKFDSVSGETSLNKTILSAMGKQGAVEEFKIQAAQTLYGENN